MWIEDAIQDVRVALWQQRDSGIYDTMIIRSAVIDAARKYGPYSRGCVDRRTLTIELFSEWHLPRELWAVDDLSTKLTIAAVKRELPNLSPRWRKALYNSIRRVHQSNGMEQAASKAKRRLRKLCA